jgi:hypothetical protein
MEKVLPASLKQLYKRTIASGLNVEPYRFSYKKDLSEEQIPVSGLLIYLKNGLKERPFLIKDDDHLRQNTKLSFKDYQFIAGLEAIWCPEKDMLEAELQGDDMTRNASSMIKRLKRMFRPEGTNNLEYSSIEMPYRKRNVKVAFGESSGEFTVLTNHYGYRKKPVIRITGTGASDHDEARSALLYISDALLFYIDTQHKIPMRIRSERYLYSEHFKKRVFSGITVKLSPPSATYSSETMAFYWNARMSTTNPVSQYLYFYQVLEQYMLPTSVGFNEKESLKGLLSTALNSESVYNFLFEDVSRQLFFKESSRHQGISTKSLVPKDRKTTLAKAIAERIYDIRCKVVHTKQSSGKEYLLPLSSAIGDIYHDLSLIEFVAREVILSKAVVDAQNTGRKRNSATR